MTRLLVMSDLDGTLLDHFSYEFTPATAALEKLAALKIPLVLNSSKTFPEMLQIRRALNNTAPFVVENGAALFIPAKQGGKEIFECVIFGLTRREILAALHKVESKSDFHYQAFSRMTVAQLVDATGLGTDQAQYALSRQYTEPLLWQDTDEHLAEFTGLMNEMGINIIKGGRFVHLSGDADKASCMGWLREYYGKHSTRTPRIIALGDSENDIPMLMEADYAIQVKSPVKNFPKLNHPRLMRTVEEGPLGWNNTLLQLLENIEEKRQKLTEVK
jgi:mannosyl-3-phosphoglycerate phosphatase family protein